MLVVWGIEGMVDDCAFDSFSGPVGFAGSDPACCPIGSQQCRKIDQADTLAGDLELGAHFLKRAADAFASSRAESDSAEQLDPCVPSPK
jgi:hypothetical protein